MLWYQNPKRPSSARSCSEEARSASLIDDRRYAAGRRLHAGDGGGPAEDGDPTRAHGIEVLAHERWDPIRGRQEDRTSTSEGRAASQGVGEGHTAGDADLVDIGAEERGGDAHRGVEAVSA